MCEWEEQLGIPRSLESHDQILTLYTYVELARRHKDGCIEHFVSKGYVPNER